MTTARRSGPSDVGGRFKLERVLGKGAQATVWLGHDQRLQRDVAVKLLHVDTDADALGEWLLEARSVSRLSHPNIVPVFDADVHDGQPCLVYEYVAGPTLAQHLKAHGAIPAHDAVAMMLGVLDALQTAHAAGVVHRDLKPSNVLLAADGRARVMDFGIAAHLPDAAHDTAPGQHDIVGTPGYLSPEAAAGNAPAATMDVFSAGLVLIELLSGNRLVQERDPYRALDRVLRHDLALPDGLSSEVDDALRAVLERAIERDSARRWPSAAAFRDALHRWLSPTPEATAGDGDDRSATVEFLLRRMRHKSDFPALSDSVVRIQRVTSSDVDSIADLSSEILKDVALTNKLLRVVNMAGFSPEGGEIGTVSRAVALIGFQGVRNMALSLVLLDRMQDKAHARQLEEAFLRALLAGMLAGEIGTNLRDSEEAFLGAMFQNLGRLLTEFYFPEEARQIRRLVAGGAQTEVAPQGEAAAVVAVLGLTFDALGLGIARAWGLPASLRACMRPTTGTPPPRGCSDAPAERLRWLTSLANRVTDSLLQHDPASAAPRVAELARQYQHAVGVDAARIEVATATAQRRLAAMVGAMNLHLTASSPASRLLGQPGADAADATSDDSATNTLHATRTALQQPDTVRPSAADLLAAGIQDVTTSLLDEHCGLNDVLHMIVETMVRALGFRRVVFCLRDAKTAALTGRFGIGDTATEVAAVFKVPLPGTDLFSLICAKGADTLISDATVPSMLARLPTWYRTQVAAPSFLLLPLLLKGAPFALIYADMAAPGNLALDERELSLLRTLRNQAVLAFRQSA